MIVTGQQCNRLQAITIYFHALPDNARHTDGMRRAVEGLSQKPGYVLCDERRVKDLAIPQQAIVRGDCKSQTIAAASILAKTARDAVMHGLDAKFPGYGLAKHKGYPVGEHLSALKTLGASPIHRRSFAPVRLVMGLPPLAPWPKPQVTIGIKPPTRTPRYAKTSRRTT
jgi:ribonuclease HII